MELDPTDASWMIKFGEWLAAGFFLILTTVMGLLRRQSIKIHARIDEVEDIAMSQKTSIALINQNCANELSMRKIDSKLRDDQRQELMTIIDRNHAETTKKLDRLIDRFLEG